jgi:tetratricopeptide (TPR) repeat protein
MSRRPVITVAAILAALCGSAGRGAWAEERPPRDVAAEPGAAEQAIEQAREHIALAETLYGSDDWEGALVEFQRAHDLLSGHPMQHLLAYNLGRCHEHLFQYGRALVEYRRYLDQAGPDAEDRAAVQARVETLEGLLATVRLVVDPAEHEVWVDHRRIGTSLAEVMVPAGSHLVEVRADGYAPAQQDIQVAARDARTLTFDLERLAEEYHGIPQGYFWATSALAVATLVAGVVVGVMVVDESDRVAAQARDPVEGMTLDQDDLDRIDRLALGADLLYGSAGLFAVAAVVLAFLTDWGGGDEAPDDTGASAARIRLEAGGGFGQASLILRGAF